uniref:Uncharacterized protein n=1 Tax=Aegilops tauschii subsp. strangulata TaxID=200361 RepID=A0A453MZW5_AEGTS
FARCSSFTKNLHIGLGVWLMTLFALQVPEVAVLVAEMQKRLVCCRFYAPCTDQRCSCLVGINFNILFAHDYNVI